MIIAFLAFLGGVLTMLSPCTLPVLPFVFARAGRSFGRSTLPLLIGMASTFALVATLAAVGGGWAARANHYGRAAALIVLAEFGLALLSARVAQGLARPALWLGNRLSQKGAAASGELAESLLLGVATGLLWAPCAGPILGLILTGAALHGPSAMTSLLLLAYASGAALCMGLAVLAGRRVFAALRGSLGWVERLRHAAGVLVLLAVAIIALGWDTGFLTRLSSSRTQALEQRLLSLPAAAGIAPPPAVGAHPLDALPQALAWINADALTREQLRGRVVLVDFWTYSCINCLRSLPYLKSWDERYRDHGLVIIGVPTPEFAFERDPDHVRRAVAELAIGYSIALDSHYALWRAFGNRYWPAHYLFDASGRLRAQHSGEGGYEATELQIRQLLQEAGDALPAASAPLPAAAGVQATGDLAAVGSPETYIGYARAERFGSPQAIARDQSSEYSAPAQLPLNQWALQGRWRFQAESAALQLAPGRIDFRFHARDLHLVLAPGPDPRAARFRVRIDGHEPGADHGSDVDAHGDGEVTEQRLYQLIRQHDAAADHTFSIELLDTGVQAYAFTFG